MRIVITVDKEAAKMLDRLNEDFGLLKSWVVSEGIRTVYEQVAGWQMDGFFFVEKGRPYIGLECPENMVNKLPIRPGKVRIRVRPDRLIVEPLEE